MFRQMEEDKQSARVRRFIDRIINWWRDKTIVQLVNHILNYIVCILSLYLIFKTLGFNTTTLVASVGSLSLAISMASRDIIADILAGIILVFSGEYQIGEIVEIGSFRGWVCNIGIRCTTLVNAEGSVKNVNNRNVNNVVNLSRRDSCVSTQVSIDYNTPLEEVEEMLRRELPELGKTIPQIVKGPTYIGVASMGRGAMTLSIEAECREEDRWTVGSAMNIGLKRMFDRNHIPMRER